jgi:RNA polymerase sigma factor (sigma-70 family)
VAKPRIALERSIAVAEAGVVHPTVATIERDEFCRELYPLLVGLVSLQGHGRDRSQELAQDALVKALERWSAVSRMDNPRAWVIRTALNLSTSRFRRRAAEGRALARAAARTRVAAARDFPQQVVDRTVVIGALAELPGRQRQVLLLRYFLDLPVAETAAVMRCSEGTVKALTHQAMSRLRAIGLIDPEERPSG